jgi:xanthine dehydrogenase accessory factor
MCSDFRGLLLSILAPAEIEVRARVPSVAQVVIVGGGPIGDALVAQAELLGWSARTTDGVDASVAALDALDRDDAVVVLDHDHAVATPVLAAALAGGVGYVGALGSRRMQAARAQSLREAGVASADLTRLHCPTGLDLGANTPAESALSIVAEMIAERTGRDAAPLRTTTARVTGGAGSTESSEAC